jgi:hypothetical protein
MLTLDFGPGGTWYVVAVHFPSAMQARDAWEHTERKLRRADNEDGVGLMRLAPAPDAYSRATGAPRDAHAIVGVSLDLSMAKRAERLLRAGTDWSAEMDPDFARGLILRRIDVVRQNGGRAGRLVIRRPENRGAALDEQGRMHEQPPGRG